MLAVNDLDVNGVTKLPYNDGTVIVGRNRVWIAPRRKQFNDAYPLPFIRHLVGHVRAQVRDSADNFHESIDTRRDT